MTVLDVTLPLSPGEALADGFGRHVERWSLAAGADAATAAAARHAAQATSTATSAGHVCTTLQALGAPPGGPGDSAGWRAALEASCVVGDASSPGVMPLVLDADGRLYLHRYFDLEQRLARRLLRAARAEPPALGDSAALAARLGAFFAHTPAADDADWQRLAAALALRGRLTIISGGPGTGKTTTVVNLLACLLALDPACRIALAAPTGKAAARLTEAVRQRAGHLDDALRGRLPTASYTVHRLLGVAPDGRGFVHHAGKRLALDVLVIDEASMLDLALATRLLEAVPDGARIVMLGDKDQLSAVESGAVFSELGVDPSLSADCIRQLAVLSGTPPASIRPPAPRAGSALRDSVVWLTRNFRFAGDSGIGRLAALVNQGESRAAVECLHDGSGAGLLHIDDAGNAPAAATLQAIADGHAPFIDAVRREPGDVAAVSAAFARFRVLCAVRDGPRGVLSINAHMTHRSRAALGAADRDGNSPWFIGRPVLVLRNDPLLQLFNGDVGITLPDDAGALKVFFPTADGGFRALAPVRLPAHETAYAMTVHKSQGSEFDAVLVLLPAEPHRVLTRELLYTAVTRARRRVSVCAPVPVLSATIAAATRRHSGLLARLRECAAAEPSQ
jgi:exodeoxyribonuclease V alpha subunit